VNRGLSLWHKDFSQSFIDGGHILFTIRAPILSHSKTALPCLETLA
jgi:hypothetical protein